MMSLCVMVGQGRCCKLSFLRRDGELLFNVDRVRMYCRGCWSILEGSGVRGVFKFCCLKNSLGI